MDNKYVKFCLKILSRFGKIIRKPQGVKFFGAPCIWWRCYRLIERYNQLYDTVIRRTWGDAAGNNVAFKSAAKPLHRDMIRPTRPTDSL